VRRRALGYLFFVWWNVWKERNRRVFDDVEQSFNKVASLSLEDINLYFAAMRS
jgi:hypothetical protein